MNGSVLFSKTFFTQIVIMILQFNISASSCFLSSVIWTLPLSWILKVSYVRPPSLTTIRCAKFLTAFREADAGAAPDHSYSDTERKTRTEVIPGSLANVFWSGVALLAIASLPLPTIACTSTPSLRLFRGQL